MNITYEKWVEIYTTKDDTCKRDCLISSAYDLIQCQQVEIDILIRKKESLLDEICKLQAKTERLKELESLYNILLI